MTLALYMDEHVDSLVTEQLANRGIDVLTVQDDGHDSLPDDVILRRAYDLCRVLVTQDRDYFAEATKLNEAGGDHYGIGYLRDIDVPLMQIVADLEMYAVCCEADEVMNTIVRLPLP
jgi:predicted nuclease of predicted toxin-antitoxin system